jgi:ABC-type branched-subunit amino acid transport system substrate-binding protein
MRALGRRLLTLSLLTLSCARGDAPPGTPLVVGAVLPLSGPAAPAGQEVLAGLEMAAAQEDAAPRLVIRSADGEGEPVPAARRFRELAGDPDVAALVGGWLPSTARTLSAVAETGGLPVISLSPLTGAQAQPAATFVMHRVDALARAAARFAREDLEAQRAGVCAVAEADISGLLAEAFTEAFSAAGGEIVWTVSPDRQGEMRMPPGPEDAADVIWVAGKADLAVRCSELTAKTREAAVLTAAGWEGRGLPELADGGVSVYVVSWFSPTDPSPENRAFLEACARAGRDPTPASALGWDAARLVREAAQRGGAARAPIRAALRSGTSLTGPTGRIDLPAADAPETPAVSSISPGGPVFLRRVETGAPEGEG